MTHPLPSSSGRASLLLWLLPCGLILLGTLGWAWLEIADTDNAGLLRDAGSFTVWGLHACVTAIVMGLAALAPVLFSLLGRRRLLTALALAVFGYLLCGLAPGLDRILFDEHIYMQIGQTLAHTGRAECAAYARAEYGTFELVSGWVNKQPNGLPYLYSLAYRIFGASAGVAHELNRVVTGLAAAFLYLSLAISPWRLPAGSGIAAGLLFLLTPLIPWWGHTAAVEPAAAASVIFAFFAANVYIRLRDRDSVQGSSGAGLLLAGATAFCVYFRPESLLVLPLVVAVLWSEEDGFMRDGYAWGALALALALLLPNLLHLYSVRGEDWGATDGRRFNSAFVALNFRNNAGYFFTSTLFPLGGTLLALAGLAWLLVRHLAVALVLAVWFALGWGIFVLFYAGGYQYGASSRYALVSCAPVALAMGVGAAWLWPKLRRRPTLGGAVGSLLFLNWTAAFSYVPTETREAAAAREDVRFVERQVRLLPHASLVISHAPTVWLIEGGNASDPFTIEQQARTNLRELANQYPGGVYLHFGYWDNVEPQRGEWTARLLVALGAEEVARRPCQHHVFALFRLDTPAGLARAGGPPPEYPDANERLDSFLLRLRREDAAGTARPAPEAPPAGTSAP